MRGTLASVGGLIKHGESWRGAEERHRDGHREAEAQESAETNIGRRGPEKGDKTWEGAGRHGPERAGRGGTGWAALEAAAWGW